MRIGKSAAVVLVAGTFLVIAIVLAVSSGMLNLNVEVGPWRKEFGPGTDEMPRLPSTGVQTWSLSATAIGVHHELDAFWSDTGLLAIVLYHRHPPNAEGFTSMNTHLSDPQDGRSVPFTLLDSTAFVEQCATKAARDSDDADPHGRVWKISARTGQVVRLDVGADEGSGSMNSETLQLDVTAP